MQNNLFSGAKLLQNRVLVEIVGKYDTQVRLGNTVIEVSKDYEKEKFVATTGIIRAVPAKLTFGKEPNDIEWDTPMQIQVGDRAVMSFMAIAGAMSPGGSSFTEGGKIFAFVHYRDLVYVTRNGVDILLNGFCLLKQIDEQTIPGFRKAIGVEVKSKFSNKYAEVMALGEPIRRYINDCDFDDTSVKVGDIVCFPPIAGIQVYKSSSDLMFKKNVFLKIQRRRFLAVLSLK